MKYSIVFVLCCGAVFISSAQELTVSTVMQLNASGGVTTDRNGNIYLSDFGAYLGRHPGKTKVYKIDAKTLKAKVFADGFVGASGSCFDEQGNFYQSNPFNHSITKIFRNGKVEHLWVKDSLNIPIGLTSDGKGSIYVCNCGKNSIGRITMDGKFTTFAKSELLKCPNGLTKDDLGNLYACNFNDGKILKISPEGVVTLFAELPLLKGPQSNVGNGHLTFKNGWLYVACIGTGGIYRVDRTGNYEHITGKLYAFSNMDGKNLEATFNKPNGIAASVTGDTLYVNVSDSTWREKPLSLHPARLRMIRGLNSLSAEIKK